MILVIDFDLKNIKCGVFKEQGRITEPLFTVKDAEELDKDEALKKWIYGLAGQEKIKGICFRILFGGDYFSRPAAIDPGFFQQFDKLTGSFPFYVPAMMALLKKFQRVFKNIPLLAFFETSFFLKLPPEEMYYALPFAYHQNSRIKKWGFHGLFHQASSEMFAKSDKTVSVVFDKQTTVSALNAGKPLAISLGYTPLEGVMSRTSCGDLDPGIVFYLMNVHKFSIYKIDEMLKNESGFLGLTGYDLGLKDLLKLKGKDKRVDLAFDVYRAQIMRHIGKSITVLGGLDNLVFAGSEAGSFIPLIYDLIKKISFLGINTVNLPWNQAAPVIKVSSEESQIKIYINKMELPRIIFNAARGRFNLP